MPRLIWDSPGTRSYESGLDRGVLYLPDGTAVPWNGLTSVIEKFNKDISPIHYDGTKINNLVLLGDFSASLKAVTYPDEFLELEGLGSEKLGVFYDHQQPQTFGLSYRTRVGSDISDEESYKIHILYNVTAIPREKNYATVTADPSIVEFEWDIFATPEEIDNYQPTAHIVIDSSKVDPDLLIEIENFLYGDPTTNGSLLPMGELVDFINNFLRLQIVDLGDGTWEAHIESEFIQFDDISNWFQISFVNAWYLDNFTYQVQSTTGKNDVPLIKIHDVGNGTWTASSDYTELITYISDTVVELNNANIVVIDEDTYQISDTLDEG